MCCEIHVYLDAGRLNFPLRLLHLGVLSSAALVLHGVPPDAKGVRVLFARQRAEPYAADARRCADGTWRAYCSPFLFPAAADGLSYQVLCTDGSNNSRWLGTGQFDVIDCAAYGDGTPPPAVPADTYIRNPVTGLYHLLTAQVNDDGGLTINLADEGVER